MSTAHPSSIPLVILPPPVPPALVRQRPPQASIPQTKQARDALLDAVRRGIAREKAVPPLSQEELAHREIAAFRSGSESGPLMRDETCATRAEKFVAFRVISAQSCAAVISRVK